MNIICKHIFSWHNLINSLAKTYVICYDILETLVTSKNGGFKLYVPQSRRPTNNCGRVPPVVVRVPSKIATCFFTSRLIT